MTFPSLTRKEQEGILKSIQNGDITPLKALKTEDPNFHWTSIAYEKTGDTALHLAARLGYDTIINYLLDEYSPCAVDVRNKDDKTPLHEAAQFAQLNSVLKLCSYGSDVNALRRGDWTPLMLACTKTQSVTSLDIVKTLVEKGAEINVQNKDGWTCLHILAREGNVEVFNYLISRGLRVDIRTKNGRTALHIAALHGNTDILKQLMLYLSVDCTDCCGNTPLHEAILGQHIDVAKILIGLRANVAAQNNSGLSVLHLAASQSNCSILNYVIGELGFDLAELNCEINSRTKNGWTAAHCAARKGFRENLELLKNVGVDLSIKDNFGRTAMDYLC